MLPNFKQEDLSKIHYDERFRKLRPHHGVPFVFRHAPGIVLDHHDIFALATTMVKNVKTHYAFQT